MMNGQPGTNPAFYFDIPGRVPEYLAPGRYMAICSVSGGVRCFKVDSVLVSVVRYGRTYAAEWLGRMDVRRLGPRG